MDLGLEERVALVTGAWRGTGRGIATVLAEEGAHVWLHGFDAALAEREAAALRAEGCDVRAVTGDIAMGEWRTGPSWRQPGRAAM